MLSYKILGFNIIMCIKNWKIYYLNFNKMENRIMGWEKINEMEVPPNKKLVFKKYIYILFVSI